LAVAHVVYPGLRLLDRGKFLTDFDPLEDFFALFEIVLLRAKIVDRLAITEAFFFFFRFFRRNVFRSVSMMVLRSFFPVKALHGEPFAGWILN